MSAAARKMSPLPKGEREGPAPKAREGEGALPASADLATLRRPAPAHLPIAGATGASLSTSGRGKRISLSRALLKGGAVGLLLPAVLALLWEAIARAQLVQPNLLPPPSAVVATTWALAKSGELATHIEISLLRVALGFLIGAAAATVLGAASGYSDAFRRVVDPTMQGLRSIPSIAWVPLFLLWLGIYEASKVTLIAVGAFFPIYLNLVTGIQGVDRKLVEVGHVYGLKGLALVRRVLLPATLPAYVVGLRGGLGLAWMFVIAAEMMGASEGLGFLLVDGQQTGRPSVIIASIILFAILGKLSDLALAAIGQRFLSWQDSYQAASERKNAHVADRPRLQAV